MTHRASAGQRYLPWLILFLSHWPFLTNSCWSCESFFFFNDLEDWVGCIAKNSDLLVINWCHIQMFILDDRICWNHALFHGFASHTELDSAVIFWDYFVLSYCLGSRPIFSHAWEIIYFFWIMCAMILSIYQHVGQNFSYCYVNEIPGFTPGISLYTTAEIPLYTCNKKYLRYFLSILKYCPQKDI